MVKRKAVAKEVGHSKRRKVTKSSAPSKEVKRLKAVQPIEPKVTRSVSKAQANQAKAKPDTNQNENGRLHPLLIDHILDKVFQYVIWPNSTWPDVAGGTTKESVQDLQNIRLVSKQWSEAASKLYRRGRSPLAFGDLHPFSTKTFDLKMEGFLDVMKSSRLIPAQRYSLGANFFIKQNQRLMKDFMRICGPTAVELRLYFDNSSSMNFNRRSFPDLNLGKMKSITFNCDSYRGKPFSNQTHEIPYLVEILLNASQRLQEFRFEIPTRDISYKWQSRIVKRLGEAVCKQIPNTVKLLRLDMPLIDAHLNMLCENDMKLEELQFDCHYVAGSPAIRKFFQKQAPNLQVLKMRDSDQNGSAAVEFPRFERLKHMELQGSNVKPFSYPDVFPKLETLNLSEWKTERTVMELIPYGKKALSLKEIFLPCRFPQAPLVKKVSQCFPNLKSVHISPSPDIAEALQEAFVYFPDVEELYVTFPFLLDNELNADSLFSGVSELDCRRIMKHRNFENVNLKDVQKKPSLNNLTKLRKLVLEDSACDVILTDFSAHFIFMKMPSLITLNTNKFRMSSKYVELLRNKLSLKLADEDCSDYSDESDGWSDSSMDNDELQIIPFLGMGFNIFFVR